MTVRAAAAVVVVLVTLATVHPTRAQNGADAKAAEAVVLRQLEAFRHDDYDTAYGFAAAVIRLAFDRAAFERMVRTGYPEIARSAYAVVSHHETTVDDRRYVTVRIIGANGNRIAATYELVREDAGWRISGVVARPEGQAV
jgi:hypothetical protein